MPNCTIDIRGAQRPTKCSGLKKRSKRRRQPRGRSGARCRQTVRIVIRNHNQRKQSLIRRRHTWWAAAVPSVVRRDKRPRRQPRSLAGRAARGTAVGSSWYLRMGAPASASETLSWHTCQRSSMLSRTKRATAAASSFKPWVGRRLLMQCCF